jgi:hypothetical protein
MKIKAAEVLKTLDGEPIVDQNGKQLTVGIAVANMLVAFRREGPYEFDKVKSYILA